MIKQYFEGRWRNLDIEAISNVSIRKLLQSGLVIEKDGLYYMGDCDKTYEIVSKKVSKARIKHLGVLLAEHMHNYENLDQNLKQALFYCEGI